MRMDQVLAEAEKAKRKKAGEKTEKQQDRLDQKAETQEDDGHERGAEI